MICQNFFMFLYTEAVHTDPLIQHACTLPVYGHFFYLCAFFRVGWGVVEEVWTQPSHLPYAQGRQWAVSSEGCKSSNLPTSFTLWTKFLKSKR